MFFAFTFVASFSPSTICFFCPSHSLHITFANLAPVKLPRRYPQLITTVTFPIHTQSWNPPKSNPSQEGVPVGRGQSWEAKPLGSKNKTRRWSFTPDL